MQRNTRCIIQLLTTAIIIAGFICGAFAQNGPPPDNGIVIDVNFPGGNVIVKTDDPVSTQYYSITEDIIKIRSDLRDTKKNWFYWCFRISGVAGKSLRFEAPRGHLGAFGPAFSDDGGKSWKWLDDEAQKNRTHFSHTFGSGENEIMFSSVIPYLQSDFEAFISEYKSNPLVRLETLAISEKGRNVEKLLISHPTRKAKHKVLISARHHACEAMASYVLEGLIASVIDGKQNELKWLRENVEFFIAPFMDKDGVEDGDQGKNRSPWDHNEDYQGEGIYKSTAALRKQARLWANGDLKLALDLHCPGLGGTQSEHFYAVGAKEGERAKQQRQFIDTFLESNKGELKLDSGRALLAYGTSWNIATPSNGQPQLVSSREWYSEIDGVEMAATLEFPYANIDGQMVTPRKARLLGKDLANAISIYLQGK